MAHTRHQPKATKSNQTIHDPTSQTKQHKTNDPMTQPNKPNRPNRPNILIILADDLGFSDVGCFGSEISTPNIDSLAFGSSGSLGSSGTLGSPGSLGSLGNENGSGTGETGDAGRDGGAGGTAEDYLNWNIGKDGKQGKQGNDGNDGNEDGKEEGNEEGKDNSEADGKQKHCEFKARVGTWNSSSEAKSKTANTPSLTTEDTGRQKRQKRPRLNPNLDSSSPAAAYLAASNGNVENSKEIKEVKKEVNEIKGIKETKETKESKGIRFTQMYNSSRCCPSRAALLTGLSPHRAGIGHMVYDAGVGVEYQGFLRGGGSGEEGVCTIAELLKGGEKSGNQGGQGSQGAVATDNVKEDKGGCPTYPTHPTNSTYSTYMIGKWHVGGEYPPSASDEWISRTMGDTRHPLPTQRGFDSFWGTLGGGGSYYRPPSLVRSRVCSEVVDSRVVPEVESEVIRKSDLPPGFYYTDAINDEACRVIEQHVAKNASNATNANSANDEADVAEEADAANATDAADEADATRATNVKKEEKVKREEAVEKAKKPFFLYVAHVAPHWPLHAPKEEIEKYKGKYLKGWDAIRKERHSRLIQQGLISPSWNCSERDEHAPPWDDELKDTTDITDSDANQANKVNQEGKNSQDAKDAKDAQPRLNKEWEDARMATYAAQITIMDRGIGRILATLRRTGEYENTLIMFLSDNGGCAEYLKENGDEGQWPEFYGGTTLDGTPIHVGNRQDLEPGGDDTFMSYDLPWANASNAPFRLFKSFVHEGGISTPFVVHWPGGETDQTETIQTSNTSQTSNTTITSQTPQSPSNSQCSNSDENESQTRIIHSPWSIMDIAATCCDVAGIPIPSDMEGESFLPILQGDFAFQRTKPIFWEHQGNCAVREGPWKLVYRRVDPPDEPNGEEVEKVEKVEKDEEVKHSKCAKINHEKGIAPTKNRWELYNMNSDRTEMHNVASQHEARVCRMIQMWEAWAKRCGVKPWPLHPIPEGGKDWSNIPWEW